MKDQGIISKKIILLLALLLSNELTWKLISLVYPFKYYIACQCFAASFFGIFSVMFTQDNILFEEYWNRHIRLKKIVEKVIHMCAYIIYGGWLFILHIVDVILVDSSNTEWEEDKKAIGIQVEIVDKMPLIAKAIIIPGVIFIIWVILISFGFVSESVSDWISNVIDFLLALGTVPFIWAAINEYHRAEREEQ